MKKIVLVLFAAISISAFAANSTVTGYLVDLTCAAVDASQPGFGANHTKECLQMADCAKGGYGVLTDDKKVIKFDKASNVKAKQFITQLKKTKDIKVNVTGTVTGEKIAVSKIQLL